MFQFPSNYEIFSMYVSGFRLMLDCGSVMSPWLFIVYMDVTLIPKDGGKCNLSNYRPISVFPVFSKNF